MSCVSKQNVMYGQAQNVVAKWGSIVELRFQVVQKFAA